jgi:hypothetical protein
LLPNEFGPAARFAQTGPEKIGLRPDSHIKDEAFAFLLECVSTLTDGD